MSYKKLTRKKCGLCMKLKSITEIVKKNFLFKIFDTVLNFLLALQ